MIEVVDLHKSYGTLEVLKGISLGIDEGEVVSIVGASGAGKTTLLQIMGSLSRADSGSVVIDGVAAERLNDRELSLFRNRKIGFVFQFHHLLPEFTAFENVCIPGYIGGRDREEVEAHARELIAMLGMEHRMAHKPAELSGGEQQRIAVAIALSNRPKLLLADEPTGSVDAKTGAYILDMLRAINRDTGVTIVIVTHDPLLAKKVNRVVAIRDGKISSERIMKQSYLERLHDINAFTDAKEVQDEYAVLDRAGRLQIPRDMLDKLQITGNRMKMELREDKIILEKPEEVAEP